MLRKLCLGVVVLFLFFIFIFAKIAKTSFSSFLVVFMDRFRARDRELGVYGIDYLYCKVIKIDFVVIYIYF